MTKIASADGHEKLTRAIARAARNEYPACDTPIHLVAAAATPRMTTNATVAVSIDEGLVPAKGVAPPRHAAYSPKPTAMMIAVRMATCRRFLLVGQMVAET